MLADESRICIELSSLNRRSNHALLALLLGVPIAVSLLAALVFDRPFAHVSLFDLSNLVGPTTRSLLHGGGLTVCTTAMGTPGNPICFHSARMPLPSLVVALGVLLFGDHFVSVALFKTVLFLLPIEVSIVFAWKRLPERGYKRILFVLLLLAPFAMTSFLADVVNLQVEEAYAYSLLALAAAILFFGPHESRAEESASRDTLTSIAFAASLIALYLAKSSLAPAVAVLTAAFLFQIRSVRLRLLLLLLVAAAPLGWALHQHHASGRYSLGTSLDGINLHKGNSASFLDEYPPAAGSNLDQYDAQLNRGRSFTNEWSFNDFHRQAAVFYMVEHPRQTLRGVARKFHVFFISLKKYGSSESRGGQASLETAGTFTFRLTLWISIVGSLWILFSRARSRLGGLALAYLALVAACALPYMAGFAYTRHASILIEPACLMCCRILCEDRGRG